MNGIFERQVENLTVIPFIILISVMFAYARSSPIYRVTSRSGIAAVLDIKTGRYEITDDPAGWKFAGVIKGSVTDAQIGRGQDRLGGYNEITFRWRSVDDLESEIKVYDSTPAVVFRITAVDSVHSPDILFPHFTEFPKGLHHFSYRNEVFAPSTFGLDNSSTPWLLFNNRFDAVIISPADNFFVSSMYGNGVDEISEGLNKNLAEITADFTWHAIMVFGRGINATWEKWGAALTVLEGKSSRSNDVDVPLKYLGYWTDNGATYYYNYDTTLGYEGTLESSVRRLRSEGIPIRYLQLDSWWYDKSFTGPDGRTGTTKNPELPEGKWNRYGGLMEYRADSTLFPDGLAAFQREVGLPLITHDRWVDPASPYHNEYKISGFAVTDPKWWSATMNYLASADVVCYEQDWLSVIYEHSPEFVSSVSTGESFLANMAQAAKANGIGIQYCMALPCYLMDGSRFGNLATARVSGDRFERSKWDNFLYTSRLASALGISPWTDVFMSSETDNLLLSTLSAGPVGIGDKIGDEDKSNIMRAVRPDGVIVKPDVPIVPADGMYVSDVERKMKPMTAWTYTDHGPIRTVYVFSYGRSTTATAGSFTPSSFGLFGNVVVYDPRSGMAKRQGAGSPFRFELPADSSAYFMIAPTASSGMAFFGDEGKYVGNGQRRIASLEVCDKRLVAKVTFAANEKSVRLFGFADSRPAVRAISGKVGNVAYDPATGKFEFMVSPASMILCESPGGDEVRRAEVSIEEH